jgi:hypothetical protein
MIGVTKQVTKLIERVMSPSNLEKPGFLELGTPKPRGASRVFIVHLTGLDGGAFNKRSVESQGHPGLLQSGLNATSYRVYYISQVYIALMLVS